MSKTDKFDRILARVELQNLIVLLVKKRVLPKDEAANYFGDLASFVHKLDVPETLQSEADTAASRYEEMANIILAGSVEKQRQTE